MQTRLRSLLAIGLIAIAELIIVPTVIPSAAGMAQEPEQIRDLETMSNAEWKSGYNGFAMLCRLTGATVHTDISEWSAVAPSGALLIVLGEAYRLPVDPVEFVDQGGAVLIASDHRASGVYALDWGVVFRRGPVRARHPWDGFSGIAECPLATASVGVDGLAHPLQQGWTRLATNRPGYLMQLGNYDNLRPIAVLPEIRGLSDRATFAAAMEKDSVPQALFLADPSMLTNQMLMCEDNAVFAQKSLLWLCGDQRRDVLILSDQVVASPLQPDEVLLPPPNPKDVIEAMKRLPPEALLEFGNLVATAAEDEGIIDELLVDFANELPYLALMRFLLVTASIILGLWLVYRLFHRRTDHQHPSAARRRSPQVQASIERRQAAIVLLDQLRSDITSGSTLGWNEALETVQGPTARQFSKQVKRILQQIYRQSLGAWSQKRLRTLERTIEGWRLEFAQGSLTCEMVKAAPVR